MLMCVCVCVGHSLDKQIVLFHSVSKCTTLCFHQLCHLIGILVLFLCCFFMFELYASISGSAYLIPDFCLLH